MQSILRKYSNVNGTILITGKTGTGKTYLAKQLHDNSIRKNEKFMNVNLASLQESLLESELFGHKKGSFTGATSSKIGQFKFIGRGTILLDEIGELSLSSQKKLLGLLEEKEFTPVGSNISEKFVGRIIAATNKNLWQEVQNGNFREDLYYRLMVFNIHLPKIHFDKMKVMNMMEYYFKKFKNENNKTDLYMDSACRKLLLAYSWPGNIREIKNLMEFVTSMAEKVVTIDDLPKWFNSKEEYEVKKVEYPLAYRDALDIFENKYINFVLRHFNGRLNHTATSIGMSKTTLISKMRKLKISLSDIKREELAKEVDLGALRIVS